MWFLWMLSGAAIGVFFGFRGGMKTGMAILLESLTPQQQQALFAHFQSLGDQEGTDLITRALQNVARM